MSTLSHSTLVRLTSLHVKGGFLKRWIPERLQNMYRSTSPCFQFWGRRPPSPQSTVSCADMVSTDAILPVLRWQVEQPPARRPRASAVAPQAPQTTAPFQNVGQNRGLRKILLEKIVPINRYAVIFRILKTTFSTSHGNSK